MICLIKYVQIVNMHENELLSEYSDKYLQKTGSGNRIKPRFLKGYCNNEALAREGIDTLDKCTVGGCRGLRNNEALAREGIDTICGV